MTQTQIEIRPTKFDVCGLDPDDPNAQVWRLYIEWRGPGDRWAVTNGFNSCYNRRSRRFDHEPLPSSRTDAFFRTHRFTLDEAKRHAVAAYPKLVWNGLRVEDGKLVNADTGVPIEPR